MKNTLILTHELAAFLQELRQFANEKLNTAELSGFMHFAEHYFSRYPMEDLVGRHLTDMFGCVYQWWRYLHKFDGETSKVTLFNPKLDVDGWVCPHTVLVVLQRDMPFLVDTIRIEMNRRNIAIHAIKSTLLKVQRDPKNQLVRLLEVGEEEKITGNEAFVYVEINLLTSEDELKNIAQSVLSVLAELAAVVRDFQPMLQAARAAEQNLNNAKASVAHANVAESQAFLAWLCDNSFTFLGCSEYDFGEQDGKKYLRENAEKRLGIFAHKGGAENYAETDDLHSGLARFHLAPQVLTFSKSSVRSRIHRQAYSDYVVLKRFDHKGDVIGEMRFLGLYTSSVYTSSPCKIPLIRHKVSNVFDRSGLSAQSHDGKSLQQILETFPREELFLSNSSELYETVSGVARINERYQVRLFMRRDPFGKFVSCLIYIPRDVFTTQLRLRIQALIGDAVHATECEFTTYFSESILARVYVVFKVDQRLPLEYDQAKLQSRIQEISRSWEDHLQTSLLESYGEEKAMRVLADYRDAFSSSYKEHFESRTAVHDISSIAELKTKNDIALSFYQPPGAEPHVVRFKIFRKTKTIELSDIIPVLEHLGLRVLSENPYSIQSQSHGLIWLHDFQLSYNLPNIIDVHHVKALFQDAFSAIWHKKTDSDAFNKLVLGAELSWREVFVLRAYASYMRQTLFNFSDQYIAGALVNHRAITQQLIALFKQKFNPTLFQHLPEKEAELNILREDIIANLDAVENLLSENKIRCELQDERYTGELINTQFSGVLRTDQEAAVSAMLRHDVGVLCAPTAFGKTVTAAAIIAKRGVNTLILVHRTELLKQWQERLQSFLTNEKGAVEKGVVGVIGGGKNKPTGKIDIAVMQSISRQGEINSIVEKYGQVIVDECHHIGAFSFDAILKQVKAKFVLGLTATPIRRDGQQPIIFMQCGPIRHTATKSENAPNDLEVIPISSHSRIELPQDAGIQDVFRHLANDAERTEKIVAETLNAFNLGRKVLVLTERTEHLDVISNVLAERVPAYFVLHGRMSKKRHGSKTACFR